VRLFNSVRASWKNTKKPQQKFLGHWMGLLLMLPGRMTFRNLSRYSRYHEKTCARWFAHDADFVSLNRAAIVQAIPLHHEQALAFDPSFVSKSGKQTYGLDKFWNGAHSRTEKGLEIAALAWIDVTHNSAYTLSVEQTAPPPERDVEQTRIDTYLSHSARVVTTQSLQALSYLLVDGYFSKKKFVEGIRALDLHLLGKLRHDANLRSFYRGPRRSGRGRPRRYDGKVKFTDLERFAHVDMAEEDRDLYSQVLHHVQLQRPLQVVVVRERRTGRYAVLYSTDVTLPAPALYRYYKARFHIEFLFRDAKQFTGLNDCQARSAAKLRFPFNASLSAVSFAKLEARQTPSQLGQPFSMASLKRRGFNQHLIDRILDH